MKWDCTLLSEITNVYDILAQRTFREALFRPYYFLDAATLNKI